MTNGPKVLGVCKMCEREKEIFAPTSKNAGLCHSCYAVSMRVPERHKKSVDEWRARNRQYWKDYYARNGERLRAYAHEYYVNVKKKRRRVPNDDTK